MLRDISSSPKPSSIYLWAPPHQPGGSLSGLGVGTPGPSHPLLSFWGLLSVELGTKKPRAGLFCHIQTYGYGGYKREGSLGQYGSRIPFGHNGHISRFALRTTFHTQIFSHSDSSSFGPTSTPLTRLRWEVPEAPETPGEQPRAQPCALHSQTQVSLCPQGAGHLPHEPRWETEGAGCGQAGQWKPALGVGVSRERPGNNRRSTEIWRLEWSFQKGFREK